MIKEFLESVNLFYDVKESVIEEVSSVSQVKNYPKNKDRVKKQLLDFFEALGGSNEKTVHYRKKLSSIMFS